MRNVLFPIVFSVAGFVVVAVLIILFAGWKRKYDIELAATREAKKKAIDEAIDQQQKDIASRKLMPDGYPACVVCKNSRAMYAWPTVEPSLLDKFTPLKDLHALMPRYEVSTGEGEHELCPAHHRMVVGKWKEMIAMKRTRVQLLLSTIETEITQLKAGAMLAWMRTEHLSSMSRLQSVMGSMSAPQLPETIEEEPISMPSMSTRQTATETPLASVTSVHEEDDAES